MPYKNPEDKREWEFEHRRERIARRRELRHIEASHLAPDAVEKTQAGLALLPFAAAGALAAYDPKLALVAGGVTVVAAAYYKKSWYWWLVAALTIVLAFLFLKSDRNVKK
jgi:hypothetical protein